jgi:hypothetical protein
MARIAHAIGLDAAVHCSGRPLAVVLRVHDSAAAIGAIQIDDATRRTTAPRR